MPDYDIRCVNCFHKSHENQPACPYCVSPQACTEFVRADIFGARMLAQIQQSQNVIGSQVMGALTALFELLSEAYPEALARLEEKAKEREAQVQAQAEEDRARNLAEAESAYREASQRKMMEELAAQYADPNSPKPDLKLVKFGSSNNEGEQE